MLKWPLCAALALFMSGCGVAYVSSEVVADRDNLRIVPLTAEVVQIANQSTYQPKQVPNAFFQGADVPSAGRALGATPQPVLTEQQRPTVMQARLPPVADPGPYRIGVGDVILLAAKSSGGTIEELTGLLAAQNTRQGYTVQDDGAIAVPDVGRIPLANLTLEEAEAQLFQSLVENRIEPTFSLEIAEFNSKRVSLGGAVGQPAIVPIALTPLFLDEALTRAGGIATPDLDFVSIRIYRAGSLFQIPLSAYFSSPSLQKTRLLAGDSVFVGAEFELEKAQAYFEEQVVLAQLGQQAGTLALAELNAEIHLRRAVLVEKRENFQALIALDAIDRDFVYLTGEVAKPTRFALPFGRSATLADALYADGGFGNETANPSQIYLLRGSTTTGAVTAWHLNARNVANLILATQMQLRPNDIIFIAEQPITRWNRLMRQIVPSLITSGTALATN